jgi:exosortase/archaeosortase family protein
MFAERVAHMKFPPATDERGAMRTRIANAAMLAAFAVPFAVLCRWMPGMWMETPLHGLAFAGGLGFALCQVMRHPTEDTTDRGGVLCLSGSVLLLTLLAVWGMDAPRLVRGGVLMTSLGLAVLGMLPRIADGHKGHKRHRRRPRGEAWGLVSLLLLAVPMEDSFQFALGYPMRRVVTVGASWLLAGMADASGVSLTDGVHTVFVDAPCSGVRMLSGFLVVAAVLSLMHGHGIVRVLVMQASGVLAMFLCNAFRTAALFLLETRLGAPGWMHEAVGVFAFVPGVVLLIAAAAGLSRLRWMPWSPRWAVWLRQPAQFRGAGLLVSAACLATVFSPESGSDTALAAMPAPQWPAQWNGVPLEAQPPDGMTQRFAASFPGAMAQFRMGEKSVLLRTCTSTTRRLHPSEDCYRGSGWNCTPMPPQRDEQGRLWTRFLARHPDGRERVVSQCIFGLPSLPAGGDLGDWVTQAPAWPDVSAWYWSQWRAETPAAFTLAVTVAQAPEAPVD